MKWYYALPVFIFIGCVSIDSERRSERFAALVDICDESKLSDVVFQGKFDDVRMAALERIGNDDLISEIALSKDLDQKYNIAAIKKLSRQEVLKKIVYDETMPIDARNEAAKKIDDPIAFVYIVQNADFDKNVRERLILLVQSDEVLVSAIISSDFSDAVKQKAIRKIADPHNSARIVRKENLDESLRLTALENVVADVNLMEALTKEIRDVRVRIACIEQLPKNVVDKNEIRAVINQLVLDCNIDVSLRGRLLPLVLYKGNSESLLAKVVRDKKLVHDDRKKAVDIIASNEVLFEIANDVDLEDEYRLAAIGRIQDNDWLIRIVAESSVEALRHCAFKSIPFESYAQEDYCKALIHHFKESESEQVLCDIMQAFPNDVQIDDFKCSEKMARVLVKYDNENNRRLVRKFLFNQDVIDKMVRGDYALSPEAKEWSIGLIPNDVHLARVVDSDLPVEFRAKAVSLISKQDCLVRWALNENEAKIIRVLAIGSINYDFETLELLSAHRDVDIATAAVRRLKIVNSEKSVLLELQLRDRLNQLVQEDRVRTEEFEKAEQEYKEQSEFLFRVARKDVAKSLALKFKEIDARDMIQRFTTEDKGYYSLVGVVVETDTHWLGDDEIRIKIDSGEKKITVKCYVDSLEDTEHRLGKKISAGDKLAVCGEKIGTNRLNASYVVIEN